MSHFQPQAAWHYWFVLTPDTSMNAAAIERVIVNVDVGTDDALSLLLLFFGMKLGLLKVEAIVCTYGNTDRANVVTNLVRILELANRTQIPVYKGSLLPIIPPTSDLGDYMGKDGFGDLTWDFEPDLSIVRNKTGAQAMYDLVKRYPGQITLISTAPLTNIGLAIRMYDDFLENVKEVWFMGGDYKGIGNTDQGAEFNFLVDPEAAYILFNATTKPVRMLPWESCMADVTPIPLEWRYDVLGKSTLPAMKAITKAEKKIHVGETKWVCCGCVLTSYFLKENVVKKTEPYSLGVELHGSQTRGMVVIYPSFRNKPINARVIQEVDFEVYKDLLLKMAKVTPSAN